MDVESKYSCKEIRKNYVLQDDLEIITEMFVRGTIIMNGCEAAISVENCVLVCSNNSMKPTKFCRVMDVQIPLCTYVL